MSEAYRVQLRTVDGGPTALGSAGSFTLVADRPAPAGGGLGFNGGQLLYLAIAACISNDLYRDAPSFGVQLRSVKVGVDGDFAGAGAASSPIEVEVEIESDAPQDRIDALLEAVERVGEIPRTLREGCSVTMRRVQPVA